MDRNQPLEQPSKGDVVSFQKHISDPAQLVEAILYANAPDSTPGGVINQIETGIRHLAEKAFQDNDSAAEARLQILLYRINTASIAPPWQHSGLNPEHPIVAGARYAIESAWDCRDRELCKDFLVNLPSVEEFSHCIKNRVQSHVSNVCHPIFAYLRDDATYAQLRDFVKQETPFDIHFGDILLKMMPGLYGPLKMELCKNFWDEMGGGEDARVHRTLRLNMMAAIDLTSDHHLNHVQEYCTEELRLVNMYFDAVHDRKKLAQAIGMMLATELMVPGRIDYQLEGWRRVGVSDRALTYLIEHTSVDVEHAHGWMENVVLPMLRDNPDTMKDIVFGVQRRLVNAGAVCDRMYAAFTSGSI